jgi:hypothetical protein
MIAGNHDNKTFVGRTLRVPRGATMRQAMRLPYNNKNNRP